MTPVNDDMVLAVDLDGTLLCSNMLHETFWSALASDWKVPFLALREIVAGKASLKAMLVDRCKVDVSLLPYDPMVIAKVKEWRDQGGRTALVTATDQRIANEIADHLCIFDEVFGSEPGRNLKGPAKANFLIQRYGCGRYVYIGDTYADLPVWGNAAQALVKSNSARLLKRAQAIQPATLQVTSQDAGLLALMKTMRPHQWLKNLLIFLAMGAAHQFDFTTILRAIAAFVAFSMIASSVYLVNDLLDLSADRAHPRKRFRPFASGAARIEHGIPLTILLMVLGGGISAALGPQFVAVLVVYYLTTLSYSLRLKRLPIIDICVLAALYTMRIIAGGVATNVPLSVWLLAFSLFFFFSLAAVKRQAELLDAVKANKLEIRGRGYHPQDLGLVTQLAVSSGVVSVLVMTLYVNSDAVSRLYHYPQALWPISLVLLYWISRVIFIAHRGEMHDDPIVFAARDRISMLCGLLVLIAGIVGVAG